MFYLCKHKIYQTYHVLNESTHSKKRPEIALFTGMLFGQFDILFHTSRQTYPQLHLVDSSCLLIANYFLSRILWKPNIFCNLKLYIMLMICFDRRLEQLCPIHSVCAQPCLNNVRFLQWRQLSTVSNTCLHLQSTLCPTFWWTKCRAMKRDSNEMVSQSRTGYR